MNKRIDIVNRYYYPVTAGIETLLTQLHRHMPKKAFSVIAHVSADSLDQANVLPSNAEFEGVHIKRYKTFRRVFLPAVPWGGTDAVVMTNFTLFPHILLLIIVAVRKLLNRKTFKFIFFPCGGFTPEWNTFGIVPRLVKKMIHAVSAMLLNYTADTIIAISHWEISELQKAGIDKKHIDLMGLGVEDEAYSLPPVRVDNKNPYIIQVSRIHPIKNIDSTIKALAKVPGNLSYVIVGSVQDQEYFELLKKLVAHLHLEKRVLFKGNVTIKEKYRLIDGALFMVHMSHNESFGLSIHEGLSRGKACILADNSAMPEAIENGVGGYVVNTTDVQTLSRQIAYLSDPDNSRILASMGAHNRAAMDNKRWEKVSNHFVRVLKF